jgi:hypothetical protein
MDYVREAAAAERFRHMYDEARRADPRRDGEVQLHVPRVLPQFCTSEVSTSVFVIVLVSSPVIAPVYWSACVSPHQCVGQHACHPTSVFMRRAPGLHTRAGPEITYSIWF